MTASYHDLQIVLSLNETYLVQEHLDKLKCALLGKRVTIRLDCCRCHLKSPVGVAHFIRTSDCLVSLDLSGNVQFGGHPVSEVELAAAIHGCHSLRSLKLSHCALTDEFFAEWTWLLQKPLSSSSIIPCRLTLLDISGNAKVSDKALAKYLGYLPLYDLQHLNLQHCRSAGEACAEMLGDYSLRRCGQLRELLLQGQPFLSRSPLPWSALMAGLTSMAPNLSRLDVGRIFGSTPTTSEWSHFTSMLQMLISIRTLNLSCNSLRHGQWKALAPLLGGFPLLQCLDLSGNNLNDNSLTAISDFLLASHSLDHMGLADNFFSVPGCAFLHALRPHPAPITIDLRLQRDSKGKHATGKLKDTPYD